MSITTPRKIRRRNGVAITKNLSAVTKVPKEEPGWEGSGNLHCRCFKVAFISLLPMVAVKELPFVRCFSVISLSTLSKRACFSQRFTPRSPAQLPLFATPSKPMRSSKTSVEGPPCRKTCGVIRSLAGPQRPAASRKALW